MGFVEFTLNPKDHSHLHVLLFPFLIIVQVTCGSLEGFNLLQATQGKYSPSVAVKQSRRNELLDFLYIGPYYSPFLGKSQGQELIPWIVRTVLVTQLSFFQNAGIVRNR